MLSSINGDGEGLLDEPMLITSNGSIKKLEFDDFVPESGAGEGGRLEGTSAVNTLGGGYFNGLGSDPLAGLD
jgi:hypothetical protein